MRRIGRRLLNLTKPLTDLDPEELSRAINVRCLTGGPLEVRPGETALGTTTGTDNVHSLFRLNDPANSAFARLAGSATALYRGTTGAFTSVDTGYSGDPLTFCGVTLPLTGLPFVFIGDRNKMRKIDRTNAIQTIGLGDGALTSTALGTQLNISIAQFQLSDSTDAAAWTMTAGVDTAGTAAGAPTAADTGPVGDKAVSFTTAPGGAGAGLGYSSIVSIARTLNLTAFPGPVTVEDDDLIAFDAAINSDLNLIDSYSVYLVTSTFTAGVIPGTSGSQNLNAYYHTFTGTDLQSLVRWGNLGFPLRRGDFLRIGTDPAATWATVTGIVIVIQTSTNRAATMTFNGMYVEGGADPDVTDPTSVPYDYRVRNFNPSTGTRGNPSAVQAEANFLSPLRQPVTVTPTATGTAALRQEIFRRGGSPAAAQDWHYIGVNTSDGGVFSDTVSDETALTGEVLEIDNDQPVTSVNSSGVTVKNTIVPVFFLVEDYCFALGDLLQPGRLYRSKRSRPENWPATSYTDVCAASEELMNGGMIGSAGFCFSRTRMYAILNNSDGTFTTEPTECAEGMVGRWAMAETPYGIAFVSPFGVRLTSGGVPAPLSDEQIGPLFRGQAANGFNAIDLTVPTALKLEYHDTELWLTYADTGGTRRQLIYNFLDKNWRSYLFGTTISTAYSEPIQGGAASLLLGSFAAGGIYTHSGFSDLGSGIAYTIRTGALDFGDPALEKLFSQIRLEAEIFTSTLTVQAFLNAEATTVTAQTIVGTAGLKPYNFEPFGTTPMRARTVSVEFRGTAPTSGRPYWTVAGVSRQLQPMIVYNEATPWEELPGGEGYLWGCLITCDTGNTARTIEVEYTTNNGSITSAATLSITADGRKKIPFSWGAVLAQQVRLRPTGTCIPWIRFKVEWLSDPEPPRVPGWNTNWESFGSLSDKWLKGILLEADTFNVAKSVVVDIDQSLAAVNLGSLTFNGRTIQHLAFAKQKGRLFRLRATDANYGKLYRWHPIFDEEPLALTRWETEEITHGISGWSKPLEAWVTLRSSGTVTLTITAYNASGTALDTSAYQITTTAGAKIKKRVLLNPSKGVLFTYVFTASAAFTLYREESEVLVEEWLSGQADWVRPFGSDDLDPQRPMGGTTLVPNQVPV